jgi:hypothetical protein
MFCGWQSHPISIWTTINDLRLYIHILVFDFLLLTNYSTQYKYQLDMRDLRLLLHLLIHHLGALAQWGFELGNSGSFELSGRDTVRKQDI